MSLILFLQLTFNFNNLFLEYLPVKQILYYYADLHPFINFNNRSKGSIEFPIAPHQAVIVIAMAAFLKYFYKLTQFIFPLL